MIGATLYIVQCSGGSYYVGTTRTELETRIAQHNAGTFGDYTSTRRPVRLVYSQEFERITDAIEAERKVKGWSRAKKEAMMRSDWNEVSRLSNAKPARGIETFDPPLRPSRRANVK